MHPALAGRPGLLGGPTSLMFQQGMLEITFLDLKKQSATVTAEIDIEIPDGRPSEALLVPGGRFDDGSLHLRNGKPASECYELGRERFVYNRAPTRFQLTRQPSAKPSVKGNQVAEGGIGKTQGMSVSAGKTPDVAVDTQAPVAFGIDSGPDNIKLTGKNHKVTREVQ